MVQTTPKELFRDLFALRDLERTPIIPWVCSFAAQLEQVPIQTLLSDAGVLTRSLINAQKLLGYDAIVNVFDASLEAEACGCQINWSHGLPQVINHPLCEGSTFADIDVSGINKHGRIPVVLEATKRLKIIKGKETAVIGYITGPLSLAKHLAGEDILSNLNQDTEAAKKVITVAGNIGLKLCRSYCELGVDAIVIAEEMLGQIGPDRYSILAAPLRSIWNVARFYNVHSIILARQCSNEHIDPVLSLHADAISISGKLDYAQVRNASLKSNCCYSRPVESSLPFEETGGSNSTTSALFETGKGFFLSTEWEVPYMTNVKRMHEVMQVIRSNRTN